jgi:hypothetical protein
MKAFRKEIYWQCDLMTIKKSNVACVHRRNISQYDSGERCGPWASCYLKEISGTSLLILIKLSTYHPWLNKIQNGSNKGPDPLQKGDNHKNAKKRWGHLKIFSRTTDPEEVRFT